MKISLSTIAGGAAIILAPASSASNASFPSNNVKEILHNNGLRNNNRIVTRTDHQSEVNKEEGRALAPTLGDASSSSCVTVTSYDESAKTVTVDVRQCLLGTCAETGDAAATSTTDSADAFFVTYQMENGSSACGFKKKGVDACYEKTIENVPCDPNTNMATLTLYARDKTMLQRSDVVDNPNLGRCRIGKGTSSRYTISKEENVHCVVPPSGTGVNPPGTCSDTFNNCAEGEYCNEHWERGFECKAYVNVGDYCGGFTQQGEDNRCDPSESFCYEPDACYSGIADRPGKCEALASVGDETCTTSADCDTAAGEWCDVYLGKCKNGIAEGACCDINLNNCDGGLTCAPQMFELTGEQNVCQPDVGGPNVNSSPGTCSETHDNCAEGEYCNKHWERGYECKAYVNIGDSCGGFTRQGDNSACDPSEAFCYYPDYCIIADVPGTCQAFASLSDETCQTNSDCDTATGEWCDVQLGKCKYGLDNGACCDIDLQNCDIGFACENTSFGTRSTKDLCQPVPP